MSKESRRVIETKERIRGAFFDLYEEKKIERISIKEITEKAQMNRGTFYVYYKDIYDLLEKTEDELIEEMQLKLKEFVPVLLGVERLEPYLPPMEFFQRYSKYVRVLLGENGDPKFVHKIKNAIKENLGEFLKTEKIQHVNNIEYVKEYIASAQIGIISFWLSSDMELPAVELVKMIRQIMLHGPIGFLR